MNKLANCAVAKKNGLKVAFKKKAGDEFVGKAVLIIMAVVIGAMFIPGVKDIMTSILSSVTTKVTSLFNF